jgi:dihydroorotase
LEGTTFKTKINKTFVNGNLVYDNGEFYEQEKGKEIEFEN